MLLVWAALGLLSAHAVGAWLIRTGREPGEALALTFSLNLLLPILIAPRPTREPVAWGIGLNLVALVSLALFGRATIETLEINGDWAIHWLEQREAPGPVVTVARGTASVTRSAMGLIPVEQLETLGRPVTADDIVAAGGQVGDGSAWRESQDTRVTAPVDPPAGSGGSDPEIRLPPMNPDDRYYQDKVRTPDSDMVVRLERRLLEGVNLERMKHGLTALKMRQDLSRLARAHSDAMRDQGFFGHVDPQGRGPSERAAAAHLQAIDLEELIGRVEGAEEAAPRALVEYFLRTPSDRRRMLDESTEYKAMGVGLACNGPTCFATVLLLR